MNTISALDFINDVQKDCKKYKVKIIFHSSHEISLSDDIAVSGYWDQDDKELNVAVGFDDWLTVLAHEYGHFCQWKENKFSSQKYTDAYVNYDEWLTGEKELTEKEVNKACELIQKCELDCEKRALRFIKKYKLYSSEELYIQKANSYVLGFEASKKKRKWFKVSPSRIKKIYSSMPKKFTKSLKPTKKQLRDMIKSCF